MSNPPSNPDEKSEYSLDELRQNIDRIDDQIHDLLMARAQWVLRVGQNKERSPGAPFYRPEREARIHRRIEERHQGPFPMEALHRIYREIISASLRMEKKLAVAYLGPEATSTHQAALKQFGSSCEMFPAATIDEIFDAVELERVDFGVTPVENSTEGVIIHTLDRFVDSPLMVCGEIVLPIVHNLLSMEEEIQRVQVVYSFFRSRPRCRRWLKDHLPGVRIEEVDSTAEAAELACREPGSAAIAGLYAAERYGLHLLAENIQELAENHNRFLVIGRQAPTPSGADKTSLMFSFQDQPGFLHEILGIFASRGINLTGIQSRPTKRKAWDYLFFIDFEGHQDDPPVAEALREMERIPGVFVKILGSYPIRAL